MYRYQNLESDYDKVIETERGLLTLEGDNKFLLDGRQFIFFDHDDDDDYCFPTVIYDFDYHNREIIISTNFGFYIYNLDGDMIHKFRWSYHSWSSDFNIFYDSRWSEIYNRRLDKTLDIEDCQQFYLSHNDTRLTTISHQKIKQYDLRTMTLTREFNRRYISMVINNYPVIFKAGKLEAMHSWADQQPLSTLAGIRYQDLTFAHNLVFHKHHLVSCDNGVLSLSDQEYPKVNKMIAKHLINPLHEFSIVADKMYFNYEGETLEVVGYNAQKVFVRYEGMGGETYCYTRDQIYD